jgi:hypothetical protein
MNLHQMASSEPPQSPSESQQVADSVLQSFPISESFNSNSSSSKLTSSDKLSELPLTSPASSPNRVMRSQNARALRRSLDSLPSFSSGESGHSPRIIQAWSTMPTNKSPPRTSISGNDTPKQRVSFDSDRPQGTTIVYSLLILRSNCSRIWERPRCRCCLPVSF